MKRYWQIFWHFRKRAAMKLLEDRTDFYFWGVVSLLWTGFNFFYFDVIFSTTNGLPGWSRPELFLIISLYTITDSFTWGFFAPNMWHYTDSVFSGFFSHYLRQPLDPQFTVLTQDNSYHHVPRFFVGVFMAWWSLKEMQISPSFTELVLACLSLAAGTTIIYLLWFTVATLSFWVERLSSINDIVPNLRRIFQVPRSIFSGFTAVVLQTVIPLALVTSAPAELLLQKTSWQLPLYLCLYVVVLFFVSRAFFFYSIKKYTATGG